MSNGTPPLDIPALQAQLTELKFRPAHINSSISALSAAHARLHSSSSAGNDPLVLALSILSPLEAAIEWLLLHLPEDDLPHRYRPSASSSDFVTGASVRAGGKNALVKGWLVDKLVKQAGFPRKAVEAVFEGEDRESVVLDILGRRLCGWESDEDGWGAAELDVWNGSEQDGKERQMTREEEIMALEAVLGERFIQISSSEIGIDVEDPTSGETIRLHILFDDFSPYPSPQYPTRPPSFYLSSPGLPAYMRLHLHAGLLSQFRDPERSDLTSVLESGSGGAVLSMVEYLEQTLPEVIDRPPDIGEVTKHLVPKVEDVVAVASTRETRSSKPRGTGSRRQPTAMDESKVLKRHQDMTNHPNYPSMLADREKLPAWKERERIVSVLESNRVLVVVGETGCGKR